MAINVSIFPGEKQLLILTDNVPHSSVNSLAPGYSGQFDSMNVQDHHFYAAEVFDLSPFTIRRRENDCNAVFVCFATVTFDKDVSYKGRANGPNEFRDEISRGECIQYCEFNCAVKFC